jgi:hypothetical protein
MPYSEKICLNRKMPEIRFHNCPADDEDLSNFSTLDGITYRYNYMMIHAIIN